MVPLTLLTEAASGSFDLSPILNFLRAVGLDPQTLLVGAIVGAVTMGLIPLIRMGLHELIAWIQKSDSKLDDAALPILQAWEEKLGTIKDSDPGLRELVSLFASGVISVAANRQEAKAIAARVLKQLDEKLAEQIKTVAK